VPIAQSPRQPFAPRVLRATTLRSSGSILLVLLSMLLLAGVAPAAVEAADPGRGDAGATSAGSVLRPTIHYEDAVAHAGDPIEFAAGDRVTVPFRPRRGDDRSVDGRAPSALPAGRLSGRAMRLGDGTTDVRLPKSGFARIGDDRPIMAPGRIIPGTGAVWDPADPPRFEPAVAVDPGALRREVFGFLPYWELSDGSTRIDWSTTSTVAYFGVGADSDGTLIKRNANGATTIGWSGWTSARMTRVIEDAHRSGTRVVLTVQSFGWSSTGLKRQKALLRSPSARARLARQIAAAVRDRGADGVNLDFEPIVKGYGDEFTALVRSVRHALDRVHRGYQLTFDATGSIGAYPIREATRAGAADAVLVMGYDYRGGGTSTVGSIAPIGGPTYDIRDTIRAYLARVPPSKVILGVPYYGRAWSTSTSKLHARNISGAKYGPSVSVVYDNARAVTAVTGRRYDQTDGVAWTAYRRENCTQAYGCVTSWRQLYYDDATALKAKYDLVNTYGLRGVGIWALGYDGGRRELTKAIAAKFIRDRVPPVISGAAITSAILSPNGDGRRDSTTASLKVTGLTTWGAKIQPVRGASVGKVIRSMHRAGKVPRYTWDGKDSQRRPVKDGTYRLTLWADDINGNRSERRFTVVVDRTAGKIRSDVGAGFVTPGSDGQADTVRLAWTATEPIDGMARLLDAHGRAVRSWTFVGDRTWAATWDGTDRSGRVVRDGRYTFRIRGSDRAGNVTVVTRKVIVDRTITRVRWDRPTIVRSAGQLARATITLARDARITVRIVHGDRVVRDGWTDKLLRARSWTWAWDGRGTTGKLVPAGHYAIEVIATSAFGVTRYRAAITVVAK